MENVEINHKFTLKSILEEIQSVGIRRNTTDAGYYDMMYTINKFLELIEE